jgi:hypothetical protein
LTTLYRVLWLQVATFIAETAAAASTELLQFVQEEVGGFPDCAIWTHGLVRS